MKNEKFVIDAALVQELGERLIGRPAIALGELIKNSFDADATICRIEFGTDQIVVVDNGVGMSQLDFLNHWMRIGTTHKIQQSRSSKFRRALTGSKGIGRLSAQFLAAEMTLESTAETSTDGHLYAVVDWSQIVSGADLNTVNVAWEARDERVEYPGNGSTGTRITLKNLKSAWDGAALEDLGSDVWMLRSPFKGAARGTPDTFDVQVEAPEIANARNAFDQKLNAVFSNWKARISGTLAHGRSGGTATVLIEFRRGYPPGSEKPKRFREVAVLPIKGKPSESLIDAASFEILVFKPEGRQPGGISVADLRDYLAKHGNVSVYDAGFRLPYYGSGRDATGHDWLAIAADQGRRLNVSALLPENLRTGQRYMQDLPAPGRIFGAVDINTNHERDVAAEIDESSSTWLQIQAGRDRLHDNRAFEQLRDLVRFSLDFYANRYRLLDMQVVEKARAKEPPARKFDRVVAALDSNKKEIPAAVYREVRREAVDARKASEKQDDAVDRRAALLAPLASAGMVALALNHEISRESRFLERIGASLERMASKHAIPELRAIADEFKQTRQRLDSVRELFAPLLSDVDQSATDRLRVRPIVEHVTTSMRTLMPGVEVDYSDVPSDLRFPLGSLAEWNAILQNLMANAWNALLDSKRAEVWFRGGRAGHGAEWLHVSDTGQGLDIPLSDADKLFEPFERRMKISPDKRSIAMGGQGLGLAIVRMIARRRDVRVGFVQPEDGYSTTFEMSWRGSRK